MDETSEAEKQEKEANGNSEGDVISPDGGGGDAGEDAEEETQKTAAELPVSEKEAEDEAVDDEGEDKAGKDAEAEADEAGDEGETERSGSSRGLRRAVLRAVVRHVPRRKGGGETLREPPRRVGSYARWLPVLKAVPWVLTVAFAISFAWDFPGVTASVGGFAVQVEGLLRIVTVSGLIGFLTNWLAITMLFQPREPRPIVGQGVIPSQRERVAWRLAHAVSDELINEEIIMARIRESGLAARYRDLALSIADDVVTDERFRTELKAVVRGYLRDVLSSEAVQERIVEFTAEQLERNAGGGLPGLALRAYRTFREDDFQTRLEQAAENLPASVDPLVEELDEALDRVPALLERRRDDVEDLLTQLVLRFVETLDVQRIVWENVQAYDERQLEDLLKRTTNEQLNYIKYLGGVLGVVGGLVIWQPVASLLVLTALGLVIYALDEALFRMQSDADDEP